MIELSIKVNIGNDKEEVNNSREYLSYINPSKDSIVIGAHNGANIDLIAERSNICYAFEPNPEPYKKLLFNIKDMKNVHPLNAAISNVNGTGKLYVPQDSGFGSFYKKDESYNTCIDVRKIRLDVFNLSNIGFIKIVVEGHEAEVIEGCMDVFLSNVPMIYLEIDLAGDINKIQQQLTSLENLYNFSFTNEGHVLMLPKKD